MLLLAVGWGVAMFAEPFVAAQSVESPREGLYILPIVATMVSMIFCNVEEPIELLAQYDIHSDIDYAHHLAISDSAGRSVVVE